MTATARTDATRDHSSAIVGDDNDRHELAARRERRWYVSTGSLSTISITIGLAAWQLAASFEWVSPLVLPRLSDVLEALGEDLRTSAFYADMWATIQPFLIGLIIAFVGGCVIGLLYGTSDIGHKLLQPYVLGFNAVPRIALIPLLIVIFGIGMANRTAIVTITSIFPIILNVASGVGSVDRDLLQMAQSFDCSRALIFRRITVPHCVPFLLSGFRIAVGLGLISVIVAEFYASNEGLGHKLQVASQLYDIITMYEMIIVLGVLGVVFTQLATRLEHRFDRWRD